LLLQRYNRSRQILACARIDLEEVLVAEFIGLLLGSTGGDHHLAILLGDDRSGADETRRIRAEQELRLVLYDQARIQLLTPGVLRLVIVADQIDRVALGAGLDAALGVDFIAPELDAAQLRCRIIVELASPRNGEADRKSILSERLHREEAERERAAER